MTMIPKEYEGQRVGVSGYRVLNLDLDGVCADYVGAMRDWLVANKRMDLNSVPSCDEYSLTANSGWPFTSKDDYLAAHRAAEEDHLYATMKPIPGVSDALQRLASEHVYIRIVTHRLFVSGQHRMVVSDTARWLDEQRIPYMSLCFAGLKDSIQATVHIDDSPENIRVLREVGQHVVVFDQPYNRDFDGPRMTGWDDANVDRLLEWFDHWPANGHDTTLYTPVSDGSNG